MQNPNAPEPNAAEDYSLTDDDTVISSHSDVSDTTIVSASALPPDENTVVESTSRELDEKTRATQRRALNSAPSSADGARVAFAPQLQRERYAVRSTDPTLAPVARGDLTSPVVRPVARPVRKRSGELVVAVVLAVTILVAGIVGGILALIFGG